MAGAPVINNANVFFPLDEPLDIIHELSICRWSLWGRKCPPSAIYSTFGVDSCSPSHTLPPLTFSPICTAAMSARPDPTSYPRFLQSPHVHQFQCFPPIFLHIMHTQ